MKRRTPVPQLVEPRRSGLVRPVRRRAPAIDMSTVVQRHDLPLVHWDVWVHFGDGSSETLYMHARDPISAVRTASYTTEREWSAEKLLSVKTIRVRRGR